MAGNSVAKLDLGRVRPVQPNYFSYMKAECRRISAANPTWDHKVVFRQAATNWDAYKSALIHNQAAAVESNRPDTTTESNQLHQASQDLIPHYCEFMKVELNRVRAANPTWEHQAIFKQAAANWRMSPDRQECLQRRSNRTVKC